MKQLIAIFFVLSFALPACNDQRLERAASVTGPGVGGLADITTRVPVDTGDLHNDAMRIFRGRHRRGMGMSSEEFILQVHHAFNKAFAEYGPSREVTVEECEQTFRLLMTEIQPYFDVFLQDPTKLDPQKLLDHWEASGAITGAEHAQIISMLRGQDIEPVSALVKEGASLHIASSEYWYGKEPGPWMDCPDCPPDKSTLKATIDLFGSIAGHLAIGGIGGTLAGYLASNGYAIYENPAWLGGGAGANGELITGYGRGPIY